MGRLPKSAEVRGRFWQAQASGATLKEAAADAGVSKTAGHCWLHESGGVRPRPTRPRPALRLSQAEREEISRGLAKGLTRTVIARQIGRSASPVSREVRRNTSVAGYRAVKADRLPQANVFRIADGRIVEHLTYVTELDTLRQLGAPLQEPWLALMHRAPTPLEASANPLDA